MYRCFYLCLLDIGLPYLFRGYSLNMKMKLNLHIVRSIYDETKFAHCKTIIGHHENRIGNSKNRIGHYETNFGHYENRIGNNKNRIGHY